MIGLLYKDFCSTKKETLLCVTVCALFLIFSVATGGNITTLSPTIGVIVALSSMAPTYSLNYDKTSGWNKFICASPISRNKVMLSKYLGGILSTVCFFFLILVVNLVSGGQIPFYLLFILLAAIFILQAVMLPVSLRFGQNSAVIGFLLLVFIPIGGAVLLQKVGVLNDAMINSVVSAFSQVSPGLLASLVVALAAVLYVASYLLSCRIFRKMEF